MGEDVEKGKATVALSAIRKPTVRKFTVCGCQWSRRHVDMSRAGSTASKTGRALPRPLITFVHWHIHRRVPMRGCSDTLKRDSI